MTNRVLKLAFCLTVVLFAVFHFAENTADPDLWGHVLFGQQILHQHSVHKFEPFSWTAAGQPWINHEVLSEIALGTAHLILGGAGLLWLKLLVGMVTFGIALSLGGRGLEWPWRVLSWCVALVAVVEISFGFAARPQIFTALGLACELWILIRIHEGRVQWALALPALFVVWINTHGGVVAGFCVLALAAAGTTAEVVWDRVRHAVRSPAVSGTVLLGLWLGTCVSVYALWLNPWGGDLLRWLVSSVLWPRPEIEEWNPVRLGWDHGPMFILMAISVLAFITTKRRRAFWEIAVLAFLGFAALRYVRNTPLFAVAVLALVPPYLVDVARRGGALMKGTTALVLQPSLRWFAVGAFLVLSGLMLRAAMTLHKDNGLTMEVPKQLYPLAAVRFIQDHGLSGNLLVFFDWGELCLWELPDCPPSIDGRLDTCYSRDVISANWNLYNGEAVDPRVLPLSDADIALLPRNLAGVKMLVEDLGWQAAYADPLAVVLVRQPGRFPRLSGTSLPLIRGSEAVEGREPFPDRPSLRIRHGGL